MVPAMDRQGYSKIRIGLALRRSSLRGGLALRERGIAALDIAAPAVDMQADRIIRRIGLRSHGGRHGNRPNCRHRQGHNTHRKFTFGLASASRAAIGVEKKLIVARVGRQER